MKRAASLLVLLAVTSVLAAASGDMNLGLGVYGMVDRELSPASYDSSRSLGLGVSMDYCLAQVAGVDVAPGLDVQRSAIGTPKDGDLQAASVDVLLHLSLPYTADINPYISGQLGYIPQAGQSGDWVGHYHAALNLGNRGYFSPSWGMDSAITYSLYSPSSIMLQCIGVRLSLLWRPTSTK